jgi:hypothetical protein
LSPSSEIGTLRPMDGMLRVTGTERAAGLTNGGAVRLGAL